MKVSLMEHLHLFSRSSGESTDLAARYMRQVLKTVRKEVLKGCIIVFSCVFPTKFQADNHHLWKMAEQLGATCSIEVDPSVTRGVNRFRNGEV